MINPSVVSSQVVQTNNNLNLNKTDSKTDNKNDKLTSDKSNSKEALTEALKKNLGLSNTTLPTKELSTNSEELNLKLKELVNKLLNQLGTKDSSKLIEQGEKLNFAPNFSNELKFLANEMKKNEIFKDLFAKLEQILKPASQMKADNLAPLFKNSGVFFEAKLKDALNKEQLPSSFHSLLNTIKSLSSPKIATQIIALAGKELDAKSSLNELKNIIQNQKNENTNLLKESAFKTLLSLGSKLENFKLYISKNPNLAQEKLSQIANNILSKLEKLEPQFKQELSKPQNLALKDTNFLKDLNQSFMKLKETLKDIIQAKPFTPQNTQNTQDKSPSFNAFVKVETNVKEEQTSPKAPSSNVEFKDEKNETTQKNEVNKDSNTNKNTQELLQDEEQEVLKTDQNDEKTQPKDSNSKTNETQSKDTNEKLNTNEQNKEKLTQDETLLDENTQETTLKEGKEGIKENPKEAAKERVKNEASKDLNKDITKDLNKEISKNTKEIPKENATQALKEGPKNPQNTQTNTNLNTQNTQALPEKTIQTQASEANKAIQNLEAKVKNLVFSNEKTQMLELEQLSKDINTLNRKLNESLKQLDLGASEAKSNLSELKNLTHKMQNASKDLAQIATKNEHEVMSELKSDIKSTLLQVSNLAKSTDNEAIANQANRLLAQIEMNQLMSLANESINTYLPFFWEDLNDSKLVFKRGKKDKFFAQIKLEFAKLGELDILIALNNEKYIDINIMAEDKEFRKRIYENAHELKRAINKAGLLSSNFFVGDIVRSKFDQTNAGVRDYDLQMGIDKKA
ncbi:flagellar hook-length control protein FliK [Campylobacter sp. MIT 12-5580]|uniref:flagellar hook-length control protein FliK n=1 Tax=Campylobacter sp. MIT 12-5580 TaxID=2040651 RepID=UPI0010F5806A|nr:flagellar hook-length control protein FliK [Campylobacter sp. MIT 12-5580]TKX29019.1 flagellar hook-length control protein FliK [Campylobacter sp. MIT 12-5580]